MPTTAKDRKITMNRSGALRACAEALRIAADYRLPERLQRQLIQALEAKTSASSAEQRELLLLVEAAHDRSLQKVKAQVALQQLLSAFPELES